jgi:hypothetical protein
MSNYKSFVNLKVILIVSIFGVASLIGLFWVNKAKAVSGWWYSCLPYYSSPSSCYSINPNCNAVNLGEPGNARFYCLNYNWSDCCQPSTPPPSEITISGELNFEGPGGTIATCGTGNTTQVNNLASTVVVLYNNSTSEELGRATVKYSSATYKATYNIGAKKASSNSYKLKATKTNYWDFVTTFSTTGNTTKNILLKPKKVYNQGAVVDKETKKPVKKVSVWPPMRSEYGGITSKHGFYHFSYEPARYEYSTDLRADRLSIWNYFAGYGPSTALASVMCPFNFERIEITKKKECDRPGPRKNVEICWWGDEAIAFKNDPKYANYWVVLAEEIYKLDAKTQTPTYIPSRVDIAAVKGYGGSMNPWTKEMILPLRYFANDTLFTGLKLTTVPHEFGHIYHFMHEKQIDQPFIDLLIEGNNLIKTKPYTQTEVYKILSPDWDYYLVGTGFPRGANGYAGTNHYELFAESFAVMYEFDTKMHAAINGTTLPADIRNFSKKVHNISAGVWPHGNKIALDKINEFVLNLAK